MRRFRPRRVLTALILPMVVASVGCGGHYSDAQRLAAAGHAAEADAMGSDGVTATTDRVGDPGATALPAATAADSGNATRAAGGGSAAVPAAGPAGSSTQTATGAGSTSAQAAAGAGATGRPRSSVAQAAGSGAPAGSERATAAAGPSAGGSPAGASGVAPAAPSGAREPIKLGVMGVRSGVLGRIFIPGYEGALAWAGDVNRRGGLAGHPVQLIAVDDGDDPRKATALAKRLVENDKVVAFYAEHQFTTFDAIIPYLEEKGMPVIGSSPSNVLHEDTPIYFNVSVSSDLGLSWNHLLPLMLEAPRHQGHRHHVLRRGAGVPGRERHPAEDRPQVRVQHPLHRPGQRGPARLHRRGHRRPQRRRQGDPPPDRQQQRHPHRCLRPPAGLRPRLRDSGQRPHRVTPARRRQGRRGLRGRGLSGTGPHR